MEVREDRAEKCMNCKHLYIKDFATGICELKGEIILPDDSCPKFESSADNTNSLKDGEKGGEGNERNVISRKKKR